LHEFILLPGWVKKTQFEALCQWLKAQGFTLVRVNRPEPWRTYPDVRFRGTVAQFNQAFHVTVMERFAGHRCYAVFTSLLMPVRFAPKGEDYVEAYSFGADASSGLTTTCYWDSSLIG
jgi:hypothetical protein